MATLFTRAYLWAIQACSDIYRPVRGIGAAHELDITPRVREVRDRRCLFSTLLRGSGKIGVSKVSQGRHQNEDHCELLSERCYI